MTRTVHFIIALTIFAAFTGATVSEENEHASRKVIQKVAAEYPEIAKRNRIRGAVKVEVEVRPNGSVKSARAIGGNPVLIESAITASLKWRFEPASRDSVEIVELVFEPHE